MHLYRFRILSDENENFVRDIEILAQQSFGDFYTLLIESCKIMEEGLASFFICDQQWNKRHEVTLIDMGQNLVLPGEDEERSPAFNIPVSVMGNSKLSDFIDDPHQRILFEYDILDQKVLFIELIKICSSDPQIDYPQCISSRGELLPEKEDIGISFFHTNETGFDIYEDQEDLNSD